MTSFSPTPPAPPTKTITLTEGEVALMREWANYLNENGIGRTKRLAGMVLSQLEK